MRVHANQFNPNAQLDALYAAQKAAAQREAARTRKKLIEFASELAGEAESDDCVVRLQGREESQEEMKKQYQQSSRDKKKPSDSSHSEGDESSVSDWA